jgi:hypothetical protein
MFRTRALLIASLLAFCARLAPAQEQPAPTAQAAPEDKPLPDIASLIARAKANQSHIEEVRKNYLCTMTSIVDDFDSKGTKKGTHTDIFQIFFVDKVEIHQHTQHDGKPLSDSDAKKEQERVDKEIAEIKSGTRKPPTGQINLGTSTLLKVAAFTNPRRIEIDGRPTIAFDYKGDPHAKTANYGEEIASKLTGTVWFDEEDAAVRKLNGVLQENFHVAGGLLVNVKKDSHFEITTQRVNGEIWFTHTVTAHIDGRLLLFKGFDSDPNITFSDYRKMKTSVTITQGNHIIGDDGQPVPDVLDDTPPTPTPVSPPKP